MHLILLLSALGLAWLSRLNWKSQPGSWTNRWHRTLTAFLFAPLLLLSSAIAVLWMGPQGQMVLHWEGWFSYGLAGLFGVISIGLALHLTWIGRQAVQQVQTYPIKQIGAIPSYVLPSPLPFIAQVGLWNSHLVISQGVLEILDAEHLEAAIAHEQAHAYYRDTFCFFWLGWLRRLTSWLPQTELLWQELLLLRELRADLWAAQQVDRLTLAEALLTVVQTPQLTVPAPYAALTCSSRLEERVTALLESSDSDPTHQSPNWLWLMPVLLPLLLVPLHS